MAWLCDIQIKPQSAKISHVGQLSCQNPKTNVLLLVRQLQKSRSTTHSKETELWNDQESHRFIGSLSYNRKLWVLKFVLIWTKNVSSSPRFSLKHIESSNIWKEVLFNCCVICKYALHAVHPERLNLFSPFTPSESGNERVRTPLMSVISALIPKLAMITLSLHYEPLNDNYPWKCDHVVEFLLLSKKRLCTVPFGICWFFSLLPPLSFGVKEPLQISANFYSWKKSTDSKVWF